MACSTYVRVRRINRRGTPEEARTTEIGTLIVDDQDDIRLLIRVVIEAANRGLFVSGEASGGPEALEVLSETDPDIIVLDQMMPGMDGLTTAGQIRRRRPGQIIILCSAYLDDDLVQAAANAGITICMSKSQIAELPERLREAAAAAG